MRTILGILFGIGAQKSKEDQQFQEQEMPEELEELLSLLISRSDNLCDQIELKSLNDLQALSERMGGEHESKSQIEQAILEGKQVSACNLCGKVRVRIEDEEVN